MVKRSTVAIVISAVILIAMIGSLAYFNWGLAGISGYVGYATDGSNNLLVNNTANTNAVARFGTVTFYANFTNSTGDPINNSDGAVFMNFFDYYLHNSNPVSMSYNSTTGLWEYATSFASRYNGTFYYNVTANSSAYSTILVATDNFTVNYACVNLTEMPTGFRLGQDEVLCQDIYQNGSIYIDIDPADPNNAAPISDIVLDCNDSYLNASGSYGFHAIYVGAANAQADNITIKNCRISGYKLAILVQNASNVEIFNVSIWNGGSSSNPTVSSNIYVSNTTGFFIHDVNLSGPMPASSSGGRGIYLYKSNRNFLIRDIDSLYNINLGDGTINITLANITDYGNFGLGNRTIISLAAQLFQPAFAPAQNVTIENSTFYDNYYSQPVASLNARGARIRNNAFIRMNFSYWGVIFSANLTDSQIYNNTFDTCLYTTLVGGENLSIYNNTANCVIEAAGNVNIFNNLIEGDTDASALSAGARWGGFYIPQNYSVGTVLLENNTVISNSDVGASIAITRGRVIVRNNLFANASPGIMIANSSDGLVIENNTIENSTFGIRLSNSNVNLSGNTFRNLAEAIRINETNISSVTIAGNGAESTDVENVTSVFAIYNVTQNASIYLQDLNFSGNFYSFLLTNSTPGYPSVSINRVIVVGNSSSSKIYSCGLYGPLYPCAHELNITNSWFTNGMIGLDPSNLDGVAFGAFRGNMLRNINLSLEDYVVGNPVYDANIVLDSNVFDNSSFDIRIYAPPKPTVYVTNNTFANESYLPFSVGPENIPLWIANNTFTDIHQRVALTIGPYNPNSTITGNTFLNVGNVSGAYFSNFAYASYSGISFDGCIFWTNGVSSVILTSAVDKKVAFADGTNDFSIALYNDSAGNFSDAGCGENITLYATAASGLDCAALNSLGYPGNCYYEIVDSAVLANGAASNYTWNSTIAADGVTFSGTPYLRFSNGSESTISPQIFIKSYNNTIKGNVFKGSAATPINTSASSGNKIYLNIFISSTISVNESNNNSACVNGEGNFYEEGLAVPSADCGQITLTASSFTNAVSWNRQSSPLPVHYEIYNNATGALVTTQVSSASQLSADWPFEAGTYVVRILPWVEGSRINGTPFVGTFTFLKGARKKESTGGSSVDVPPYIAREQMAEEEIPPEQMTGKEVVPAKPGEEAPVAPGKEKPAEIVPEKAPSLPQWVVPLVLLCLLAVIIISIVIYQHFAKSRKEK